MLNELRVGGDKKPFLKCKSEAIFERRRLVDARGFPIDIPRPCASPPDEDRGPRILLYFIISLRFPARGKTLQESATLTIQVWGQIVKVRRG